jgi:simple sugar transport system ATP-binding protein
MDDYILEMENITKIYGNGVYANKEISMNVKNGEIHALMGENGAGKSTLMKVLFGIESLDGGSIKFNGENVSGKSPQEVIKAGIGMVHQHFMLINSLTVYENVILGMEPKKGLSTDSKKAIEIVQQLSDKYNLKVNPLEVVENLSVGLKQKVEILKVLARNAKLLILDEPTAVLTPQETQELFEQLLLLKKNGHTIIFISHKIREVMQICDRVTIIRRGQFIKTIETASSSEEEISRLMVGRDVILQMNKSKATFGKTILEIDNLEYTNDFHKKMLDQLSFKLKQGQILGVAGVEGNGQNELADCIFGLRKGSGQIVFEDNNILNDTIKKHRENGISFIPEDRLSTGLAESSSVWENIIADRIDSNDVKTNHILDNKKIRAITKKLIKEFKVVCKNEEQEIGMLSGGNMQKIVVAREMSAKPLLIIANQPTRGIDVGANEFIWKKLIEYRDEGVGILLISADLNEILELSDSIMVMYEGKITGYFEDSKKVTEEDLGKYMLGLKKQEREG